jgi:hypothetical protein
VTPLGDIHANVSFYNEILAPFARVASNLRVDDDVNSYAEGFEEIEAVPTDTSPWPDAFWQAWEEEIQIELIGRQQHDLGRLALELVLQHREVGRAVGGGDDDLAVDDGGTRLDAPGVMGDLLEPMRPMMPDTSKPFNSKPAQEECDSASVA